MAQRLHDLELNRLEQCLKRLGITPTPKILAGLMDFTNQTCQARIAGGRDTFTHPAVVAVKAIAKTHLPAGLFAEIIQTVGEKPDVDRLRRCYREWHARGKPPAGWGWVLEWYPEGIPPRSGAAVPAEARAASAAEEYRRAGYVGPQG